MNNKKRPIVMIVSVLLLFSVLFTTVAVAALSEGGISALWNNAANTDGVVKYEKPSVGDIAQDGAYPDEIKSNSSANAQEKEWYEYITYSETPILEVQDGTEKIVFYDPYDYQYGSIMEFSNPRDNYGSLYDPEGYTTANEISVSYSHTDSHSWSKAWNRNWGLEEEVGGSIKVVEVKVKAQQSWGFSGDDTWSDSDSIEKSVSYNALYFNTYGTPYRWRVVKYTVYLPLYCEMQTLVNGEWVVAETNYCLLATVQGTCREWINNVAYIEDWRTGEPVQVENYWKEFFSKEALINAYKNQMIPQN